MRKKCLVRFFFFPNPIKLALVLQAPEPLI